VGELWVGGVVGEVWGVVVFVMLFQNGPFAY